MPGMSQTRSGYCGPSHLIRCGHGSCALKEYLACVSSLCTPDEAPRLCIASGLGADVTGLDQPASLSAPATMISETIASTAGAIRYQNFLAFSMSLRPFVFTRYS